jgi:hypothetical protein
MTPTVLVPNVSGTVQHDGPNIALWPALTWELRKVNFLLAKTRTSCKLLNPLAMPINFSCMFQSHDAMRKEAVALNQP